MTSASAAALVGLGLGLGWRGVDLPAQLYRVAVARSRGLTLWDSQWYGGHWTLNYSVVFPVTAAFVGIGVMSVVCAAAAALAFDRLVVGLLGRHARLGSAVFAVSVIVETAIGQLAFFCGEAFALWCVVAASRRRWWLAAVLAAVSSLASPLAGAFAGVALFAWWLSESIPAAPSGERSSWTSLGNLFRRCMQGLPLRLLAVSCAALMPIVATAILFPGQGDMPYPVIDWAWELAIASALWVLTPYSHRAMRWGILVFVVVATLCVVIASPVGGNIGRIEDCLALPLTAVACCDREPGCRPLDKFHRIARRPRVLLVLLAVPLALSQWSPAWAAIMVNPARPSTHQAFYTPLVDWLDHTSGPEARVEVVPTADHWEAVYVAPTIPLARGWERQLDVAQNPIFYNPGALNATSYLDWLRTNGVAYVALPNAPLDYAGTAEGRLVSAGVTGLTLVWHDPDWRVYQVESSGGIVTGPARLTGMRGGRMSLDVVRAGSILVRVRWSANWQVVAGDASLSEAPGGWMTVKAHEPGLVRLDISF